MGWATQEKKLMHSSTVSTGQLSAWALQENLAGTFEQCCNAKGGVQQSCVAAVKAVLSSLQVLASGLETVSRQFSLLGLTNFTVVGYLGLQQVHHICDVASVPFACPLPWVEHAVPRDISAVLDLDVCR